MTNRWRKITFALGLALRYLEVEGLSPFAVYLLDTVANYCVDKRNPVQVLYKKIQLVKTQEIEIQELGILYRNMLCFCGDDKETIRSVVADMKLPTTEEEYALVKAILDRKSSADKV